MEKDVTISARISKDLAKKVDALAKRHRRSRSWLVEDALSHYTARELEFLALVEEGRRDKEAGRVYSHQEVVNMLKRRRRKLS